MRRVGGVIKVSHSGQVLRAKGNFEHNLGENIVEEVVGADGVHGYKEMPQAPFVAGEITDDGTLDRRALIRARNATVTLDLANGKTFFLNGAVFTGEGTGNSEEGNMAVRFVGDDGGEILAS